MQFVGVYVMLCLYIFIITLSTVAIMTYVRGVSVAADNREVFVSLSGWEQTVSIGRKF